MTVGGDAATEPVTVVGTTVAAVEALCFARDLGGSLTHVIIAAAGRALAASPEVKEDIGGPGGSDGIRIVIAASGELRAPVVRGAASDPLPRLRAVTDSVLDEAREGRLTSSGEHAAITIVEHGVVPGPSDLAAPDAPCILEVGPLRGDPPVLELRLHVDRRTLDPVRADELLSRIASLVERPYRRLM